jgi:adenylyltransferase/sulfurtransferase
MRGERYSRQVLLPFVGAEGQEKVSKARVAIVGLGALGCVASDLLVRAGIGFLRLVDRDLVELNNLQRQTLYTEEDVGTPKAVAARRRLRSTNPEVDVEAHVKDVNYRTVMPLLQGVDLVVDGTDNIETRYVLNEACIKSRIPLIYGAALGMDGMTGTLWPPATPCFRCLFPTPPAPGSLPTCETAGILNSAAAVVGSLQASQALRYILQGKAEGCLYVINAWDLRMERVAVRPREDCPTCVEGRLEYLEARRKRVVTQLCGSDAVSVDPLLESPLSLEDLSRRLRKAGRVKLTPHILLLEIPPYSLTVFPDGRAVIKGTGDEKKALSLYARYVGV